MTSVLVVVELMNDDGDRIEITAEGHSVDDAIGAAAEIVADETGDDSFVMTDWRAA